MSQQALERLNKGEDGRDHLKLLVLHHSLTLSADSVLVDTEELEKIQQTY